MLAKNSYMLAYERVSNIQMNDEITKNQAKWKAISRQKFEMLNEIRKLKNQLQQTESRLYDIDSDGEDQDDEEDDDKKLSFSVNKKKGSNLFA